VRRMPPPVIGPRQAGFRHFAHHHQVGQVEPAEPRAPESQQQFVVLPPRKLRREPADGVECRAAVRHVGGHQAHRAIAIDVEGLVAVIDECERAPVLPREPLRRRCGPDRQHAAAHAAHVRVGLHRIDHPLQPVRAHEHVVIGEGDDGRARQGDALVAAVRHASPLLEPGTHQVGVLPRGPLDHAARRVGGVVVDDDDLVPNGRALRHQPLERGRQLLGAVARAEHDRNGRDCTRGVLARGRCTGRCHRVQNHEPR
jgi:hypothetical protein